MYEKLKTKKMKNYKNTNKSNKTQNLSLRKVVGEVYRIPTATVAPDNKKERNYAATRQSGEKLGLSKIKSIKKFDKNGKNADLDLQEINQNYPGLTKRSGVDHEVHWINQKTKKIFNIEDAEFKDPLFKLSSHDNYRVRKHIQKHANKKSRI